MHITALRNEKAEVVLNDSKKAIPLYSNCFRLGSEIN
jgi:hypothetical protein